jgi:hypothetical protein
MKKTHYAVRVGKRSNVIVKTWRECSALVTGFPGALFKGFDQEQAALNYLAGSRPTKKTKPQKPQKPQQRSFWDQEKYPCIERKSYRDLVTGIYYKNRCVRRRGPTMTGVNYEPSTDDSVPWFTDQENEEQGQINLVREANQRI